MDALIVGLDRALRTLSGVATARRPLPGTVAPDELSDEERRRVAALMRVNHSGEVCAQALYLGQAVMAYRMEVRGVLAQSADEEVDHLDWAARRINELGGATSVLNPLWFFGAFTIGAGMAVLGDRWSLGFLRETEKQVVEHLDGHLERLPPADRRTRAILEAMRDDEARHAETASRLGAIELPAVAKLLMRGAARVMTATAYRV